MTHSIVSRTLLDSPTTIWPSDDNQKNAKCKLIITDNASINEAAIKPFKSSMVSAPDSDSRASETTPHTRSGSIRGDPLAFSPLVVAYNPLQTVPILSYPPKASVKSTFFELPAKRRKSLGLSFASTCSWFLI